MKKIAGKENYRLSKKGLNTDLSPPGAPGPKVWVVTEDIDYEGSRITGIYSSEEKAKAAAVDEEDSKGSYLDDVRYNIKEYMVN